MLFETEISDHPPALGFDLPFDPKDAFGKVRAAVRVTINGYEFRTTVVAMGGRVFIGLNREVRAAASVAAGDRVRVEVVLDDEPRTVEIPADLAAALEPAELAFLESLSFTHRKEYVRWIEDAKRAETRQARIVKAATMLRDGVRHP
ncbi:MAG TPA: YdeI/OmpD-associated family protein [Gaiellaceae bacterium]|nr:YdeI/OmpD-associated family protein [Gaiellaceae bacterium]